MIWRSWFWRNIMEMVEWSREYHWWLWQDLVVINEPIVTLKLKYRLNEEKNQSVITMTTAFKTVCFSLVYGLRKWFIRKRILAWSVPKKWKFLMLTKLFYIVFGFKDFKNLNEWCQAFKVTKQMLDITSKIRQACFFNVWYST